jgi:hypothetical protein
MAQKLKSPQAVNRMWVVDARTHLLGVKSRQNPVPLGHPYGIDMPDMALVSISEGEPDTFEGGQ